jgi:hypothetical protein
MQNALLLKEDESLQQTSQNLFRGQKMQPNQNFDRKIAIVHLAFKNES